MPVAWVISTVISTIITTLDICVFACCKGEAHITMTGQPAAIKPTDAWRWHFSTTGLGRVLFFDAFSLAKPQTSCDLEIEAILRPSTQCGSLRHCGWTVQTNVARRRSVSAQRTIVCACSHALTQAL
jgi:hypothetical protein